MTTVVAQVGYVVERAIRLPRGWHWMRDAADEGLLIRHTDRDAFLLVVEHDVSLDSRKLVIPRSVLVAKGGDTFAVFDAIKALVDPWVRSLPLPVPYATCHHRWQLHRLGFGDDPAPRHTEVFTCEHCLGQRTLGVIEAHLEWVAVGKAIRGVAAGIARDVLLAGRGDYGGTFELYRERIERWKWRPFASEIIDWLFEELKL